MRRINRITVARAQLEPEEEALRDLFVVRVLVALAPLFKRLF